MLVFALAFGIGGFELYHRFKREGDRKEIWKEFEERTKEYRQANVQALETGYRGEATARLEKLQKAYESAAKAYTGAGRSIYAATARLVKGMHAKSAAVTRPESDITALFQFASLKVRSKFEACRRQIQVLLKANQEAADFMQETVSRYRDLLIE